MNHFSGDSWAIVQIERTQGEMMDTQDRAEIGN
jgi:hypothetical protein